MCIRDSIQSTHRLHANVVIGMGEQLIAILIGTRNGGSFAVKGQGRKMCIRDRSKLKGKGAQVTLCDLTATDLSYAVTSAFYCGKLVLACSTYDGGLFPHMKEFLEHLQTKGFRNRRIGLIENGSWAPAAARLMRTKLEEMKDIHLYETVVSLRGALNQTSEAQMDALVAELCAE